MASQLYWIRCEENGITFQCDLPIIDSPENVGIALDKLFSDPRSVTIRKRIVNEVARRLFHYYPDSFGYVLEYASKRRISVYLSATVTHTDLVPVRKYLTYLIQRKLSIPTRFYDKIIDALLGYSPDRFIDWIKMLIGVGFTIPKTERRVLWLAIQSISYPDIVRLLGDTTFASVATIEWLDCSIQNPDGRVFDALLEMVRHHPPTIRAAPSSIHYHYNPNLRSLTKLIQFVLFRKCTKGWDDPSLRFRTPLKLESLESMALLGSFKDSIFVDMMCKIGSTVNRNFQHPTPELLVQLDRQANIVIAWLKDKLPNVLVDLVLEYLV